MIYIVKQITQRETAADKREFVQGITGTGKVSAKSVVAGLVAGWLLTGRRK